jgi:hypothetical protein
MNEASRAAIVVAQANCALITAMGLQAENQISLAKGEVPAFGERQFRALIVNHEIRREDVLGILRESP